MQHLKERLFEHVAEVLDEVEQPRLPAVKAGPWRKIWEKSARIRARRGGQDNSSDTHLRELLQDLHQLRGARGSSKKNASRIEDVLCSDLHYYSMQGHP
jgi:hypothetical protein